MGSQREFLMIAGDLSIQQYAENVGLRRFSLIFEFKYLLK
jgi:hypothetical protein